MGSYGKICKYKIIGIPNDSKSAFRGHNVCNAEVYIGYEKDFV